MSSSKEQEPWPGRFEHPAAALLFLLCLGLAYGPAKLAGHVIYSGVIQDVTNLYGFFCWDQFTRSELLSGRIPLWNPHNAFGVPHLANMQSAVFYPLNWLKWAFGFWRVIDPLLLMRLWLAGMFAWLFARGALRARFWPAMTAGVAFMLCGYFTRFVYMSHLNVEVLLPLQLLLVHRLAKRPVISWTVASGAGFALLVFGGFPEASMYAIIFSSLYFLYVSGLRLQSLVTLLAALCTGALLSAPQWLVFIEYLDHAWTYHNASSGLLHLDPRLSISLVLPWFFGENRVSPAVPFLSPYLGVVPFALGLSAITAVRKGNRENLFFAASTLVLLGLVYGVPPFSFIGRLHPFSLTYNHKYASPVIALSVSVMAAAGLERILLERRYKPLFIVCALVLAWMGVNVFAGMPPRHWFKPLYALGLLQPGTIAAAVSLVVMLAALGVLASKRIITPRSAAPGIFVLCLLGLVYDMQGNTPDYHDDLEEKMERLKENITGATGNKRVYADTDLKQVFPNRLLPTGYDDLRYYDPLYPEKYVEYMAEVNDIHGDSVREHYDRNMIFALEKSHVQSPLLPLANLSLYMLSTRWEERLLVQRWARSAFTKSPRKERWLSAETVSAGGDARLSLIDHAPVLIQGEALFSEGGFPGAGAAIRFEAGIPDNQVLAPGYRGDGVFFMIRLEQDREGGLSFARYLDPKRNPEEFGWNPCSVEILIPAREEESVEVEVALLPGPRGDFVRDAAALSMLRLYDPAMETDMDLFRNEGPPYIYASKRAFPRAWLVRGFGTPPGEKGYMEMLSSMARQSPQAFTVVALLKEAPSESGLPEVREKDVQSALKMEARVPGRVVMRGSQGRAGFMVVSDQYFPGWRAFVKGEEELERRIRLANGAFMAVGVPAGEWRAELLYEPVSFKLALWSALAALLSIALFLFVLRTKCLDSLLIFNYLSPYKETTH